MPKIIWTLDDTKEAYKAYFCTCKVQQLTSSHCISKKWGTLGRRSRSSSREDVRTWKSSCASWEIITSDTLIRESINWNNIETITEMQDWLTCSSNELMCHRYSLRISRRHPASSKSSSPGSAFDRAARVETRPYQQDKRGGKLSDYSPGLVSPFRSCSRVADSWFSLHALFMGESKTFSSQQMKDGHAAKPWSKEFRKQVFPKFNRPGTIPEKEKLLYFKLQPVPLL